MTINRAVAALEANDPSAAVEPLLKAWRSKPSRGLAELISQVSALATDKRGRVTGSTREARGASWDAMAKQAHPADLGALLEALGTFPIDDARTRLTELEERGLDPRIGLALADLMLRPPQGWRGAASVRFWAHAIFKLREEQDTRVRDRLPELNKQWQADRGNAIGRYLSRELPHAIEFAKAWSDGTLPEADAARLSRFLARPSSAASKSGAQALATVFSEPSNVAARQVLADVLVEAGDPRGEFINLQLSPKLTAAQRSRQSALIKQHGRKWLGPLDSVIHQSGLRFERGFPVAASAGSKSSSIFARRDECEAAVGRPEWSTFEELDLESWAGLRRPLVCHEVMRSLRVLHGAWHDVFDSDRRLLLEEANFHGTILGEEAAKVFASKQVPSLRRLRIAPNASGEANDQVTWAPLWKSRVMQQLEQLTVLRANRGINEWFDLVDRPPANVKKLAVEAGSGEPWAVVFDRTDGDWVPELRYGWDSRASEAYYRALDAYLAKVKRRFPRVTFDFVRFAEEPSKELRATLVKIFKKRLGAEEVTFIEPTARPRAGRR